MVFPKLFQSGSLLIGICFFFAAAQVQAVTGQVMKGRVMKGQAVEENIFSSPGAAADDDPQWGKTPPIEGTTTVLRGLHKGTARIFALKVPHGKVIKFGTLKIIVRACRHNPPDEKPENAAFVEIFEEKAPEVEEKVFSGWMFGSSPSLSTLEHPTYDIWVTDCLSSPSQSQKTSLSTAD